MGNEMKWNKMCMCVTVNKVIYDNIYGSVHMSLSNPYQDLMTLRDYV